MFEVEGPNMTLFLNKIHSDNKGQAKYTPQTAIHAQIDTHTHTESRRFRRVDYFSVAY